MISHLARLSLLLLCAFVYASLTGCRSHQVTTDPVLRDFVKNAPYKPYQPHGED